MDTLPDNAAHILVVDDDQRIRDLLARYLFEQGFRVTTATDATSARAAMRGLAFDVVILDVMMPGESGLELARDLKSISSIPICMLTARPSPSSASRVSRPASTTTSPSRSSRASCCCGCRTSSSAAAARRGRSDEIKMGDYTFHVGRGELQAQGRDDQAHRAGARPVAPVRPAAGNADRAPRAGERQFHRQRARHRRADQPAAPQDRDRSGQSRLPANGRGKGYILHTD